MTTVLFSTPVTVQLGEGEVKRSLSGLAVPFGVPSQPSMDGERYTFTGPPANLADLLDVVRGHDDNAVIGRLSAPLDPGADGLSATARVFGTTAGSDVLVEATEGVLTGFSVSADITEFETAPDGVRSVTAWTARHLGVVRKPAFTEAANLRVAASAHPTGGATVTTTTTEPAPAPVQLPTVAELAAQVAVHLGQSQRTATHRLAEFATFGDYAAAVMAAGDTDPDRARQLQAAFAVADQITTDNPGVIPPGWRNDIKMVLDARRPAIAGTGGPIGLPDAGMDANWPYFNGNLDAIIAEQVTQKTDLSGPKISILKASTPIHTAGAVSDISYQLLQRSSPSYLDAYTRILMAAWARYTEAKFEHALTTGGTAAPGWAGTSKEDFSAYLFGLSAAVEDATGAPASVVGVAKDVWLNLGGAGFPNPAYGIGTGGAAGTSSASELRVNVNGLEITRWPFLANGQLVATNGAAARFAEAGPYVATAEDVRKLGRDVAVWGMYEEAEIYFPAGVQVASAVIIPPEDGGAGTTTTRKTASK